MNRLIRLGGYLDLTLLTVLGSFPVLSKYLLQCPSEKNSLKPLAFVSIVQTNEYENRWMSTLKVVDPFTSMWPSSQLTTQRRGGAFEVMRHGFCRRFHKLNAWKWSVWLYCNLDPHHVRNYPFPHPLIVKLSGLAWYWNLIHTIH